MSQREARGEVRSARLSPEEAARQLFDEPKSAVDFMAADEAAAAQAVREFTRLFAEAPGVFKQALEGARAGAETLSGDRLQGLAEIIQNADDAEASFVRFQVVEGHLLATHDGHIVTLSDVLSLATPWLSNKVDNATATGRFGIGLMTLRALSDVLDVHSGPYHIRLGDPTISAIDAGSPVLRPVAAGHTALCLPLRDLTLDSNALVVWLNRWDDSALLFLRSVKRVTVCDEAGTDLRTLRLSWSDQPPITSIVGGNEVQVVRRRAQATDGRVWLVHAAEPQAPTHVKRSRKASASTVPIGLAVPLQPEAGGLLYAGLPVEPTDVRLRANAQFDPVTSRASLAPTPWNGAMLPLVADLWVEVVQALFSEMPSAAWHVIPLPADGEGDAAKPEAIERQLEGLLLARSRDQLAVRATLIPKGHIFPLSALAVEAASLEGVITREEVARLGRLSAALPSAARDPDGRWRAVLADWRQAGAPLPSPVSVEDALELLRDADRGPVATTKLTAVGLAEGHGQRLRALPCVVTAQGEHVVPPTPGTLQVLIRGESNLADRLGIGVRLADEYSTETPDVQAVLTWLRDNAALLVDPVTEDIVSRLAAAGMAGSSLPDAVADPQLRALRDAFEQMPPDLRADLGRGVGRAIRIRAFRYDAKGRMVVTDARPADVYLPRAIDKEPDSFAVAADRTVGLLWAHSRYGDQLRSGLGRATGLGPQKFLGLLGAERTPRVIRHPNLQERFTSDSRLGLSAAAGPRERTKALNAMGATFTLNDLDSPDLLAVATGIGRDRKPGRRRDRANALIATLARAWDRLEDQRAVDAAHDHYNWQLRGPVIAYWLWALGAITWLDDTAGLPRPPVTLRLRTPGTLAVHGASAGGYLRPEFDLPNRREVLAALGVTGDPSTGDLVGRLRQLREMVPAPEDLATDAAIVYQALSDRLSSPSGVAGDLSERDLRNAFAEGSGLILTAMGWRTPTAVLSGSPIFRGRHAFVPQIPRAERLWSALRIRQPSLEDCLRVVRAVARTRRAPEGDDLVVLLETYRLMAEKLASSPAPRALSRRLANLPLYTTMGWWVGRPVYGVDDPSLVQGLGDEVPVWVPGGDISQFAPLFAPLKIARIDPNAVTVVHLERAERDEQATGLFAAAVSLLQDDLARNAPLTAGSLSIGWDRLRELEVQVHRNLSVEVTGLQGREPVVVEVAARADPASGALHVRDVGSLRHVDGAGRAIAGLFNGDRRQLAQAWLVAWVAAEDGRRASELKLAEQQAADDAARTEERMAARTAALKDELAAKQAERGTRARQVHRAKAGGEHPPRQEPGATSSAPPPKPRLLVDPSTLGIAKVDGQAVPARKHRPARNWGARPPGLPDPGRTGTGPQVRSSARTFTDLDKESVGLEIARLVLGGDAQQIADLRAQRGVGADAIDDLKRFFELKVHLGDEPDMVSLQDSQIRRALSTPDFFLVVVSNVEGVNARPRVRIIVDPVHQLTMTPSSSVTYTGIRSAQHSLVYELGPALDGGDEQPPHQ